MFVGNRFYYVAETNLSGIVATASGDGSSKTVVIAFTDLQIRKSSAKS